MPPASAANAASSARTPAGVAGRLLMRLRAAAAAVRSGSRNSAPGSSRARSQPPNVPRHGTNWSGCAAMSAAPCGLRQSMSLPGLLASTPGRCAVCGSKYASLLPLANEGTSVTLYTELKPKP